MGLCALCKKNETDRVIHGVPVCDGCYVEGRYDLSENHLKLIEMSGRPMHVKAQVEPQEPRLHKHYYRKDGTCACGAVLSPARMKKRELKAKK